MYSSNVEICIGQNLLVGTSKMARQFARLEHVETPNLTATGDAAMATNERDAAGKKGAGDEALTLGIDLGTSRTAIMSDRGAKNMVRSVVGYPKDLIGLKVLGRPYVVGQEAFDMYSYLDLRFPLQAGVLREIGERDLEVARHLINHVIQLVNPQPKDRICGIVGVPARASAANKALLLKMAREVMDTALVISEPFAVAYGQDKLVNAIVVDIGAGTLDICALKGVMPAPQDQVTLLKAGNYIDERLEAAISERHPEVQINRRVACHIKETYSYVGKNDGEISVELRAAGKPVSCDVSEEIRVACESLIPDIIENLEALVQGFDPEVQRTVLQNIILAGGGSRIRGLDRMIVARLGAYGDAKVTCVDDPDYDGCKGALKLAQDLPPKYWNQLGEMVGA